jgi:hypothetical protein
MRNELAGYYSRGWSAFLAGAVKRDAPLRLNQRSDGRLPRDSAEHYICHSR